MSENEDVVSFNEQLKSITERGITLQPNSVATNRFEKLVKLIYRNKDLFATNMHDLLGTDVETMHIDTGDANPVRKRAYRQSTEMQRVMQLSRNKLMKCWLLKISNLVNHIGAVRAFSSKRVAQTNVNDLLALNQLTKPIFWPIPTLEDIFDTVSDNNPKLFTHIDMIRAYYGRPME